MKGYLMQEQAFVPGKDNFIESYAPENNYGVVFEDDGETGYFYAVEKDKEGAGLRVLDALHIYEAAEFLADKAAAAIGQTPVSPPEKKAGAADGISPSKLLVIWSRDWMKCALVIDGSCQAIYDFEAQGGYNINEFPPPNDIWTKGDRKLTDEMVRTLF
ncbi:MAG TPA: DUF2251 domain-containing protein [Puia sp.]|nr:DUF2251 domain-containing protein [Puia sp.]